MLSRLTQTLLAATLGQSGTTVAQWRVYLCLSKRGPSHLNGIADFTKLPQSSLSQNTKTYFIRHKHMRQINAYSP